MRFTTHIAFNGQCEEAFQLYARCFGGKILTLLHYGESPMAAQVPQEFRNKILHATLTVEDAIVLYGTDMLPEQYQPPKGFHLTLGTQDPSEAERIFRELSHDGTVQMPLQKTFWAVLFGELTDRFGVSWEINCEHAR